MKAMILAAGFGTRLRPITYTLPKPMVPVCNRPLISYAVERFLAAGIRDLVVNLHHLPEAIERYLTDTYGAEASFHFSREEQILGTGGGVRRVRPQLESGDDFLVVNADTIQFPKWEALLQARRDLDALAALTLRHPPEGDRFTPVYFDGGRITGFGNGTGEALMFSGSHAISTRIFGILPEKDFSGIVDEAYQPMLDSGRETIAGYVDDGLWFDIGKPTRYTAAANALRELTVRGDVPPARGSRVDGDSIVDESARGRAIRSSVGARSVIEGDVRDSSVWDDCRIAAGVTLDGCVVAHGVEIAEPVTLRNVIICRDDVRIPRDAGFRVDHGLVITPIG